MDQTIGKRIVYHRKRLGLTQDALAEKLGVTAQAVSKWENDQSCPDITMLPKLAEIFGISTDALLGLVQDIPAQESTAEETDTEHDGMHYKNGNWEFKYNMPKRGAVAFAAMILLIGGLYLVSSLLKLEVGLWDIIWPSALLVFGIHTMFPKFSFFGLGCILFGGFSLINQFMPVQLQLDRGVVIAILILLAGGSLLMDALGKPRKPVVEFSCNGNHGAKNHFSIDKTTFQFDSAFNDRKQLISMPLLRSGMINTSFGDFEIDLSGVKEIAPGCRLEANTSFGDLTIVVPSKYEIRCSSETAFADLEIDGKPDAVPAGVIQLNANVSFGQITVEYI